MMMFESFKSFLRWGSFFPWEREFSKSVVPVAQTSFLSLDKLKKENFSLTEEREEKRSVKKKKN